MPVSNIKMIFCDCCGKLIKVETFGDALTQEEMKRYMKATEKKVCLKCKIFRKKR